MVEEEAEQEAHGIKEVSSWKQVGGYETGGAGWNHKI